VFCSNCDHLKILARADSVESNPWVLIAELVPDREEFEHLKYPPFVLDVRKADLRKLRMGWGDLRAEGYIGGKLAITKTLSGSGVDRKFVLIPDDQELIADGADTTRVVLRVTDEFGAVRTYANDPIAFELDGPAELIGDNPFALVGGCGAVWVRAGESAGTARLKAKHPRLGEQIVTFALKSSEPEEV
jgi:beta-galactosidase